MNKNVQQFRFFHLMFQLLFKQNIQAFTDKVRNEIPTDR